MKSLDIAVLDDISEMPVSRYRALDLEDFPVSFEVRSKVPSSMYTGPVQDYTMVIGCLDADPLIDIEGTLAAVLMFVPDGQLIENIMLFALMEDCAEISYDDTIRGCREFVLPYMIVTGPATDQRVLCSGPLRACLPIGWLQGWVPLGVGGSRLATIVKQYVDACWEPGQSQALPWDAAKSYTKGTIVMTPDGGYAMAGCDISAGGQTPVGVSPAAPGMSWASDEAAPDTGADADAGADSSAGEGGAV
jgi:hypothetical protein